jgi:hypothetical protein
MPDVAKRRNTRNMFVSAMTANLEALHRSARTRASLSPPRSVAGPSFIGRRRDVIHINGRGRFWSPRRYLDGPDRVLAVSGQFWRGKWPLPVAVAGRWPGNAPAAAVFCSLDMC